ncbi:MAG: hypothetical protein QG604_658 [Candidatus Dependentiae bacterium]|nr:hypothetical protein [Candidatus Dependentiae bacterium]
MKYLVLAMGALIAASGSVVASSGTAPSELEYNSNRSFYYTEAPAFFERIATSEPEAYGTWELIKTKMEVVNQVISPWIQHTIDKVKRKREAITITPSVLTEEMDAIDVKIEELHTLRASTLHNLCAALHKAAKVLKISVENANPKAIGLISGYMHTSYATYLDRQIKTLRQAANKIFALIGTTQSATEAPGFMNAARQDEALANRLTACTPSRLMYGLLGRGVTMTELARASGMATSETTTAQERALAELRDIHRWASQQQRPDTIIFEDEIDAAFARPIHVRTANRLTALGGDISSRLMYGLPGRGVTMAELARTSEMPTEETATSATTATQEIAHSQQEE